MKRSVFGVIGAAAAVLGAMLATAAPAGARSVFVVRPGDSIQAAVDAAPPGATIYVRRGTYAENVAITTDGIKLRSHGAKIVPPATSAPNVCSSGRPAEDGICAVGDVSFPDPEGPAVVNRPVRNVTI